MKTMNKNMNRLRRVAAVALLMSGAASAWAQTSSALDEARAALRANDLNKASELLEPLTGEGAQDAAAFHLLSNVRMAEKNTKAAVELAEKATILDHTKAAYFSQLGMALGTRMTEVGFTQQAMMAGKLKQAFTKAVELDPNDLGGLIGLVRYYVQAPEIAGGSLEKAREYAVRLQRIDPFLGAMELGGVAERSENFEEALKHFEAAGTLRRGNTEVEKKCGQMLAKLGRKDEARARFQTVLKLNPADASAGKSLAELDAPVE
jgi:tetratricopeptide (TPR) repeat protein